MMDHVGTAWNVYVAQGGKQQQQQQKGNLVRSYLHKEIVPVKEVNKQIITHCA